MRSPLIPVFLLLGVWIVALSVYARFWRRTKTGQEWRAFNGRLDARVRGLAIGIRYTLLMGLGVAIMLAAVSVRSRLHPGENTEDASPLAVALILVSSYIIALYAAYFLTNFIWSLVPSMRRASASAKVGLPSISFRNALLLNAAQAMIVVPICLAQIYFGVVMR